MRKLLFFLMTIVLAFGANEFNDQLEKLQKELSEVQNKLEISEDVNVSKYTQYDTFNLLAFKKNYIMPFVYDDISHPDRKPTEAEFQLSIMVPLFKVLNADFFFGYTMHAVWQVYDKANSAPFRDTNHEPQFFMLWQPDYKYKNFILDKIYFGIIHQSNGKNVPESRSWNRSEIGFDFRNLNFPKISYSIHFWNRFDENKPKSSPTNPEGDDNPDLTNYIGTGYVRVAYQDNGYLFEITHQNDFFNYSVNKGNVKVEAIIPSYINKHFKWYAKYFYGYGNTLIDYNVRTSRIGLGIYVAGFDF